MALNIYTCGCVCVCVFITNKLLAYVACRSPINVISLAVKRLMLQLPS